jgi:outer membrane protein assembly factor BamB
MVKGWMRPTSLWGPLLCSFLAIAMLLSGCTATPSRAPVNTHVPLGFTLTRCGGDGVPAAVTQPPITSSAIYTAAGDEYLYSLTLNGAVRWCHHFSVPPVSCGSRSCPGTPAAVVGQPVVAANVVYVCVSHHGNYTYAFDAGDGDLRWQRQTSCISYGPGVQPVLADGLLYAGNDVLDPTDGAIRGQLPFDATALAAVGTTIYAFTVEGTIYALAAGSDAVRWQYSISGPNPLFEAGNMVYVGDPNFTYPSYPGETPKLRDFHALDARTGDVLWSYPSGPVVAITEDEVAGLIFVTAESLGINENYTVEALTASTGALRWQYQVGPREMSAPVVGNSTLYFSADGVFALNALDGTIRWFDGLGVTPSTALTPVTVSSDTVYLERSSEGVTADLYALSAVDGSLRWHTSLMSSNTLTSPVVG